jgi:NifU-like protein
MRSYPERLTARILFPGHVGRFTPEEAVARGVRCVTGRGESLEGWVVVSWLVDETDGVIADAKFHVDGPPALIGAAEAVSELLMRKTYDQARRISAELIDRYVRDHATDPAAYSREEAPLLAQVLEAVHRAADLCMDIPISDIYVAPPMDPHRPSGDGGILGWASFPKEEKLKIVREVIAGEIRPYIELDAGDVTVVDILGEREIVIAYAGSCTSCHSATGATLNAIQQILRAKIDPAIVVTPELANLTT